MFLPEKSIIASGPVIIEEHGGRVCTLLNRHKPTADKPNPQWQFCGGTMEDFDISLEETARREAREEMGFDIKIERLIDICLVKKGDGGVAVLVHYLAKRIGEVVLGQEIAEGDWFPVDDLPEDCAPNIKPIISKLL